MKKIDKKKLETVLQYGSLSVIKAGTTFINGAITVYSDHFLYEVYDSNSKICSAYFPVNGPDDLGEWINNFYEDIKNKTKKYKTKKIMKTKRTFLTKTFGEGTKYFSIPENQLEDMYIHNTYNDYGQLVGHTDAGDWSVLNHSCDLYTECINAIKEKFLNGLDTDDLEINDDFSVYWFGWDLDGLNVSLSEEKKAEIQNWIKEYEEKNSKYGECRGFNYWDGHNWRTVVVSNEFDDFRNYEVVDDEDLIKELNEAVEESEFYKEGPGYREYRYGKWSVISSNWQEHFEEFIISEIEE
jgi:hypothetical protein